MVLLRGIMSCRQARYAAVSAVSALLAEAGLTVGYGVAHWPTSVSVLLSLAICTPVSYLLNRLLVWHRSERPRQDPLRELIEFMAVAAAGALAGMVLVVGAEHLASLLTTRRVVLTVVVDAAGLVAMFLVWIARYFLLDRVVFKTRVSRPNPVLETSR